MPASSLARMAQKACIRNISLITEMGDAPYDVIKPLLLVMDPKQLHQHEKTSPQIVGRDAEIWKAFIKRDIEEWQKELCEPKDPRHWYTTYRKLAKGQAKRIARDEEMLKTTLDGIKSERAQNTSRKVELDIVKPPNGIQGAREVIRVANGTKRLLKDTNASNQFDDAIARWEREHGRHEGSHVYPRFKPGIDLAKTPPKTKSKLAQIRKEAVNMSRFQRPLAGLTTKSVQSKIAAAPAAFIQQYKNPSPLKAMDPTVKAPEKFQPKKRRIEHVEPDGKSDALQQREKRLRTLKGSSAAPISSSTTPSKTEASDAPHELAKPKAIGSNTKKDPAPPRLASPNSSTPVSTSAPALSDHRQCAFVPIPRTATSSPPARNKPMAKIRKPAVNIFMPPKRQRVN